MAQMTSRERVASTLARRGADRVPIFDKFWFETDRAYREQLGYPLAPQPTNALFDWSSAAPEAQATTLWDIFGMDIVEVGWPDQRLRLVDPEVVEETKDWATLRDGNGAITKWWKHKMGTPEHVGFEIDTPEKWAAVRDQLVPERRRIRWEQFWPLYRRARQKDRFVCYGAVEPIEMVKDFIGHEMLLISMIERPDWVHDLFNCCADFAIGMFKIAHREGMTCDGAFIYGDMAYRAGPLMSPAHYREFLQPCHERMFDAFHQHGLPVIFHSDGDIRLVLDDLIAAGVDAINPMEAKAGMDVRKLAPQYGTRLGFVGNIDATILSSNDLDLVRSEIRSKLSAAMKYGGYIYHSDHSVPPAVTLATYQFVLAEVREAGRYL